MAVYPRRLARLLESAGLHLRDAAMWYPDDRVTMVRRAVVCTVLTRYGRLYTATFPDIYRSSTEKEKRIGQLLYTGFMMFFAGEWVWHEFFFCPVGRVGSWKFTCCAIGGVDLQVLV